ncbi:hypothetical protein K2173_017403 [Erythroxylum novogranatense]|uniref:CASP-like protein n=1 Tax=Erythroxylum novogranatense TaxID=1862640 RepID=A0AAV8TMM9_9ROSI|nr:hypothetical protein K2173_017403 [Erythroxylum novogranatense]
MKLGTPKVEGFLRLGSIVLLIMTACMVRLDSQKKFMLYLEREVTYKYLKALAALFLRLYPLPIKASAITYPLLASYKGNSKGSYSFLAWCSYLLDQLAVYITFATTTAALEHSILVLTGAEVFQWMSWCNKFTRYCFQIGGGLFAGYAACVLMALISVISANNLFRLYSP